MNTEYNVHQIPNHPNCYSVTYHSRGYLYNAKSDMLFLKKANDMGSYLRAVTTLHIVVPIRKIVEKYIKETEA